MSVLFNILSNKTDELSLLHKYICENVSFHKDEIEQNKQLKELCDLYENINNSYVDLLMLEYSNDDMNSCINSSSITNHIGEYIDIVKNNIINNNYNIENYRGSEKKVQTSVNNLGIEVINHIKAYIRKIDNIKIKLNSVNNANICENCNKNMSFDVSKNTYFCEECNILINNQELAVYTKNTTPYHHSNENIIANVKKELNKILGRTTVDVENNVINKFNTFRKKHYYNKPELTYKDYRDILKSIKEPKLYNMIPTLMAKIDNIILPNPSYDDFLMIIEKAKNIIVAFNVSHLNHGKKNLNVHYAIRKAISLLYTSDNPNHDIINYIHKHSGKTYHEKEYNFNKIALNV
jgi:hypothetical protein